MPNSLVKNSNLVTQYCNKLPDFISNSLGKKPKEVASHSRFNTPIEIRQNMGNSSAWADANDEVKLNSINQILHEAIKQKMSLNEAIFALSVAHIESGFNPDAAAGTSSASGIGQFINKTGELYGLDDSNRFDIEAGSKALVSLLNNNISQSMEEVEEENVFIEAYSHYHDGSIVSDQTREFASKKIPTLMEKFTSYLVSDDCLGKFISE